MAGHDPVFIASQGGINFFIGNHPAADGTTAYVPGIGSGLTSTHEAPARAASQEAGRPLRPSEVSAHWFRKGLAFWRERPGDALALYARKVGLVWNRRELPNTLDQEFFGPLHSWLFRLPILPGFALVAPIARHPKIVLGISVVAGVTQPIDPRVLAIEPLSDAERGLGLLAGAAVGPPGIAA